MTWQNIWKSNKNIESAIPTSEAVIFGGFFLSSLTFLTSLSPFKLHFIDFFPLFSYPVDTGSRQSRVRKKGEFYVSK